MAPRPAAASPNPPVPANNSAKELSVRGQVSLCVFIMLGLLWNRITKTKWI